MARHTLEQDLLRALRGSPDSTLAELAAAAGLPRSNFGRQVTAPIDRPLQRLVDDGLVEQLAGRYRLTDDGRRALADNAVARGKLRAAPDPLAGQVRDPKLRASRGT